MAPLIGKFDFTTVPFPVPVIQLLSKSVPSLALIFVALFFKRDYFANVHSTLWPWQTVEEFDFIIVGGGSAGAVLGNRLSKNNDVLLLEGGGDPNPIALVPAFAIYLQHLKGIDYNYYTVPQQNACLAMIDQKSFWPRGKGLGGSSNLNFMIYQRGNPKDYDDWVASTGSSDWSYENVLPFFKKSEDYHGYYPNPQFHSVGGPLYVSQVYTDPNRVNLVDYFVRAGVEKGFPSTDPNAYQQDGFSYLDVTIRDGTRWGTYTGFLKPNLNRTTLHIYRYSTAVKIHLDKSKRAYGVTYVRHGTYRFVRARKEVIISAGAIDSPKLLMLSGIGPRDHLHSVGLPCRLNLPVGKNLQDHVLSMNGPFTITKPISSLFERDSNLKNAGEYLQGKGTLATPVGITGVGYISSSLAKGKVRTGPDLQYLMSALGVSELIASQLEKVVGLNTGVLQKYFYPNRGRDGFFVFTTLGKPRSRGEVRLNSKDPWDNPIIDPRYYTHPDDIRIMVEGYRFLVNMVETAKSYREIGAKFVTNHFPGCEQYKIKSDAYYECFLRTYTLTLYHPAGTCSMGKARNDSTAVVDSQLRVIRAKNLRVMDASVMPVIPNANLNAPVIMIAERGAEYVLSYWASQYAVSPNVNPMSRAFFAKKCFYSRHP